MRMYDIIDNKKHGKELSFRTQKLSSLVPKIVRWKRRVKIGSRRLEQKTLQKKF